MKEKKSTENANENVQTSRYQQQQLKQNEQDETKKKMKRKTSNEATYNMYGNTREIKSTCLKMYIKRHSNSKLVSIANSPLRKRIEKSRRRMMWWCFIVDCVSWQISNVHTSALIEHQSFNKGVKFLHWQLLECFFFVCFVGGSFFIYLVRLFRWL